MAIQRRGSNLDHSAALWEEEDFGADDDEGNEEGDESNLANQIMNATWRTNLIPRPRYLELTVFKKMLAQGLTLTRHCEEDSGNPPKSSVTVFVDRTFRYLWWHSATDPRAVEAFALSTLLHVGTANDPRTGSTRNELRNYPTLDLEDYPVLLSLQFTGSAHRSSTGSAFANGEGGGGDESGGGGGSGGNAGGVPGQTKAGGGGSYGGGGATSVASHRQRAEVFFTCDRGPDQFSVVQDGFSMVLEHAELLASEALMGSGASGGGSGGSGGEGGDIDGAAAGGGGGGGGGFGPSGLESAHPLTCAHEPPGPRRRLLLALHHLYQPDHHPNHPRRVLRFGAHVEVLYSSEYVVEFNGQLMRLPNPFFGPGLHCRGTVAGFDSDSETYTVAYLDGPFEHDEPPKPDGQPKLDFPVGTLFEYVKRGSLIVDQRGQAFSPQWPRALLFVSALQLAVSIWAGATADGSQRPPYLMATQVGSWSNHCPDNRSQAWRLWSYQFLPANWLHLLHQLAWQLVLGTPINTVHGDGLFLLLHQGLAVPLGALAVSFGPDAHQMTSSTVVSGSSGLFALVGVHLSHLLLTWTHSEHGALPRWARLFTLLVLCCGCEVVLLRFLPFGLSGSQGHGRSIGPESKGQESGPNDFFHQEQEVSVSLHAAGLVVGALFSVAALRNVALSKEALEYHIPIALWLLAVLSVLLLGWTATTYPPTPFPLFPDSRTNLAEESPECCWRAITCELRRRDLRFFTCERDNLLGPTDTVPYAVKGQTCGAYRQFAALAIKREKALPPPDHFTNTTDAHEDRPFRTGNWHPYHQNP